MLEAQKGPESLQEALRVQAGNHRLQQNELQTLIESLRITLNDVFAKRVGDSQNKGGPTSDSPTVPLSALRDLHIGSQKAESFLESLQPQLGQLEQGLGRVENNLSQVRKLLETRPEVQTRGAHVQIAGPGSTERPVRGDQWESAAVMKHLEDTQMTLGDRIRTNTFYNAVFTYTATAITISTVYLLLRGTG